MFNLAVFLAGFLSPTGIEPGLFCLLGSPPGILFSPLHGFAKRENGTGARKIGTLYCLLCLSIGEVRDNQITQEKGTRNEIRAFFSFKKRLADNRCSSVTHFTVGPRKSIKHNSFRLTKCKYFSPSNLPSKDAVNTD